jgi:hypothetical protein
MVGSLHKPEIISEGWNLRGPKKGGRSDWLEEKNEGNENKWREWMAGAENQLD